MPEKLSVIEQIFSNLRVVITAAEEDCHHITAHLDEVIFVSVSNLAVTLKVSEATIVRRFAQLLGYSGFPDMREDLITSYKDVLTSSEELKRYLLDVKADESLYQSVTGKEITYLVDSMQAVDEDVFRAVIERTCHADILGDQAIEPLKELYDIRKTYSFYTG